MLCDASCMQDVFMSLNVDKVETIKDNSRNTIGGKESEVKKGVADSAELQWQEPWPFDGDNLVKIHIDDNGTSSREHCKVSDVAVIKDKNTWKFGTDLIIAKYFEWKPGWLFWLMKNLGRIMHSSNRYDARHPRRQFRLGSNIFTDDMLENGLCNAYSNVGIDMCRVGAKLKCDGQPYGVDCDVNLLVNECCNVDARGVIKGLKAGAHQAMFFYKLESAGNFFQEIRNVLFGLNEVENDFKAYGIDISVPTAQVNNGMLNVCNLLSCDKELMEIEEMDFLCSCSTISKKSIRFLLIPIGRLAINLQLMELCGLDIDSSYMKVLECLIVSYSKRPLEPHVDMDFSLLFTSSKLINEKSINQVLLTIWQELCIPVHHCSNFQCEPLVSYQILHGNLYSLLVQEDGMDAGFAFLHYKALNVIEFECSFVPGVELNKVLQMLELLQLALAIKHLYMEVRYIQNFKASLEMDYADFSKSQHGHKVKIHGIAVAAYSFQERMIKNRLQAVDMWLVKWKWKKLCGRKMNFWKIGTREKSEDYIKRQQLQEQAVMNSNFREDSPDPV
ncbi:hypothetical protein Tco_1261140, partial [Tanacetum coccineum]